MIIYTFLWKNFEESHPLNILLYLPHWNLDKQGAKNAKKIRSRNLKWRIKYSNEKFEKSSNYAQNWYTKVFEVADHDFAIRLSKFKIVVNCSKEAQTLLKIGIHEVSRSLIKIRLSKFKIDNPIWRWKIRKKLKLSRSCYQTFKIQNGETNMTVKN